MTVSNRIPSQYRVQNVQYKHSSTHHPHCLSSQERYASPSLKLHKYTQPWFIVLIENIKMVGPPEWFNLVRLRGPPLSLGLTSAQVYESKNVVYRNMSLTAKSINGNVTANSDGWDLYRTDNAVIKDSVINNSDDCVSFKPSRQLHILQNVVCSLFSRCNEYTGLKSRLHRFSVSRDIYYLPGLLTCGLVVFLLGMFTPLYLDVLLTQILFVDHLGSIPAAST